MSSSDKKSSTPNKHILYITDINAPIDVVWEAIMDFPSWKEWNKWTLLEVVSKEEEGKEISIKDGDKGIGLTIVGGETTGSLDLGIFVKSVTNDGPAAKVKGHTIQAGDRLIAINGVSLEGVQHHEAVQLIRDSNPSVTLLISQMAPPTTFRRKNDYNSSSQRSSYAPDIYDDNPVCHSDDEGLEEGEDYGCCPVNYPLHHASSHVHSSLGISLQNQTSLHDSLFC